MVVNLILVWLFVGGCIFVLLDGTGVPRRSRHSAVKLALATAFAIVLWPMFAWKLSRHPAWTMRAIRRNLWGRG